MGVNSVIAVHVPYKHNLMCRYRLQWSKGSIVFDGTTDREGYPEIAIISDHRKHTSIVVNIYLAT